MKMNNKADWKESFRMKLNNKADRKRIFRWLLVMLVACSAIFFGWWYHLITEQVQALWPTSSPDDVKFGVFLWLWGIETGILLISTLLLLMAFMGSGLTEEEKTDIERMWIIIAICPIVNVLIIGGLFIWMMWDILKGVRKIIT